jgi:hypothetical protein
MVGGTWSAVAASTEEYDLLWHQLRGMALDSLIYLWGSFFGPLIFLKASPALIDGASDVLNVAFSERGERNTTEKLGTISSLVGVSCIIGPLISDRYTSMERLRSLQEATTFSMFVASIDCLGVGLLSPFFYTCLFRMAESAEASAIWISSSILLQRFTRPEQLWHYYSSRSARLHPVHSWTAFTSMPRK